MIPVLGRAVDSERKCMLLLRLMEAMAAWLAAGLTGLEEVQYRVA